MSEEAKNITDDAALASEAAGAEAAHDEVAASEQSPDAGATISEASQGDAADEKAVLAAEDASSEDRGEVDSEVEESEEQDLEDEESEEELGEEVAYTPEPPEPELTPEELAAQLASQMDWYILKVQSNRENSIVDALHRRVAVAGLEPYFGEIIVPVEMVTEFKAGKKKVVKRKLYPGYIVVQMVVTEETWFLVRETPGVGDFTGAGGKPTPMSPQDVEKIRPKVEADTSDSPRLKIDFKPSDKVKINEGTFENFEGEVATIDEASGRVSVMINIFGRSTPVELEYWQVERV